MRFSRQEYWSGLPFPPPVDRVLSEPFTMAHPSWVALHSMAYNFVDLSKPLPQDKAVVHEGTIKKAEHQIIDVFELWCRRRLLRVPWTSRRSNQSILKKSTLTTLKGLRLKLQYFGHLMGRASSLEKTLMLGKIEDRRSGWQRMRWLDGITDSMDMSEKSLEDNERQGSPWSRRVVCDWTT